jgi:hypothetical protein
MPRNIKGGNKAKKFSNKSVNSRDKKNIPLPVSEDNSHIAKVTGVLGDCRFNIEFISDSGLKKECMISHLPRSSRKYGRIVNDSIVKVSKRDFENKCDILYTYDPSEVQYLYNKKIIEKDEEQNEDNGDINFILNNGDDEIDISDI